MLQSFIIVFTLTFTGGHAIDALGDTYNTYDMCMVQGEAEAKAIGIEIDQAKVEREIPVIENISVRCVPVSTDGTQEVSYAPIR